MATSNTFTSDFVLRLRDGRSMGIAAVGKSDGFPIFHCHGSGSSRLEVNLLAAAATARGVQLIGLDRPGIGRSDAKAGYRLLDWPDDMVEVADQIGIERFAVEGISVSRSGQVKPASFARRMASRRLVTCSLLKIEEV